MSPDARTFIGIILIPLLLGALWYYWQYPQDDTRTGIVSTYEGNLVKDNPGFERGVWYLAYNEPGFAALSVPLAFNASSRCGVPGRMEVCDMSFIPGDRVRVDGSRMDDHLLVETLVFVSPHERSVPVRLYYYDARKDTDETGNVLCSAQGLTAVERFVPATDAPLADTIKLLLRGEISDEERARGITSELPLLDFRFESATVNDGVATITFSDPQNKTSGGSCRVSVLRAQIEATAKQFPEVKEVRILPQDILQP